MSRRTPLGRVLGLGSAKDGTGHWWAQRISAVALAPLGLWFAVSIAGLTGASGADYLSVVDWLSAPLNTALTILLVATMAYHSHLGVQVVVEDYTRGAAKVFLLIAQKFLHVVLAVVGILAILRTTLGT